MASTDPKTATQGQWEDLASKIKSKVDSSSLATVATTGNYSDLNGRIVVANSSKKSVQGGLDASGVSQYGAAVYGDGAQVQDKNAIAIGARAHAIGEGGIAIGSSWSGQGEMPTAYHPYSIAMGYQAKAGAGVVGEDASYSVALGAYSKTTAKGEVSLGGAGLGTRGYNSTQYRLLTNLYDPQSDHDAATKGYVDPTTGSSAPTTSTVGRLGEIFIDTTNSDAYMCVAVDDVTPAYTWKKITP